MTEGTGTVRQRSRMVMPDLAKLMMYRNAHDLKPKRNKNSTPTKPQGLLVFDNNLYSRTKMCRNNIPGNIPGAAAPVLETSLQNWFS